MQKSPCHCTKDSKNANNNNPARSQCKRANVIVQMTAKMQKRVMSLSLYSMGGCGFYNTEVTYYTCLTHQGLDIMDTIWKTTLSKSFLTIKKLTITIFLNEIHIICFNTTNFYSHNVNPTLHFHIYEYSATL